jgi:endonuclease/exonuclease/phosphatase family metal-dependent hydrolase
MRSIVLLALLSVSAPALAQDRTYRVDGEDAAGPYAAQVSLRLHTGGTSGDLEGTLTRGATTAPLRGSLTRDGDGYRVRYGTAGLSQALTGGGAVRSGRLTWCEDRLRLEGTLDDGARELWTPRARPGRMYLKLMTINIQGRAGHVKEVSELIADEQPDVVGLQEVMSSQPKKLAERTGYQTEWKHATTLFVLFGREGDAVMSRHPILQVEKRKLPKSGFWRRIGVRARVEVAPGLELDFYTTHLHHPGSKGAERVRVKQARDLLDWMQPADGRLSVLSGDLNTRPDGDVIPLLTGPEGGLLDTWVASAPGQFQATHGAVDGDKRIDYLLVPQRLVQEGRIRVLHTWIRGRGLTPDDPRVSDHRAVVTLLEVRR